MHLGYFHKNKFDQNIEKKLFKYITVENEEDKKGTFKKFRCLKPGLAKMERLLKNQNDSAGPKTDPRVVCYRKI